VDLDHTLGTGLGVEGVDVLGDHRLQEAAPLELRQRLVGPVRLHVGKHLQALAVEAPETGRIAAEGVDVRDLHRVDLLPDAHAGRPEVGDT
jgi:hypothetical protein